MLHFKSIFSSSLRYSCSSLCKCGKISNAREFKALRFFGNSLIKHKQLDAEMQPPQKSKVKQFIKMLGIGIGIGTVASGAYLYNNYKKINNAILSSSTDNHYILSEAPPKHSFARSIQSPIDNSGLKITLYQFQTCPFCCKVRAFLDYYGFSYNVVEVNSVTHTQTKWTPYRKVPFLVVEQTGSNTILQLKDSSMIISILQSFLVNKEQTLQELTKGYPMVDFIDDQGTKKTEIMNQYGILYGNYYGTKSNKEILHEKKWRQWADKVYVHMISPNVYRTLSEAYQAFEWFSKVGEWESIFSSWERMLVINVGAVAMFLIGKRLKTRHGLKNDVRESFYEETNIWLKELKARGGPFMGGAEPNLADLAIYGVLMSSEGCDAFQDLMSNTKLKWWFSRMQTAVQNKEGSKYLIERGSNVQ